VLLLLRWRKLLKSFFNEKKQQFDISKVPDIYDSAKYDAIHNSHLQLTSLKVRLCRCVSMLEAAPVVPAHRQVCCVWLRQYKACGMALSTTAACS
jgi:hypothetical protein